MGGPPIRLDHLAFDAVAQHKPVADSVRLGEVERYAREDVAQSALQGKAEDNGDRAGCGYQRSDRDVEYVGDDREDCCHVDDADNKILKKPSLTGLVFEDEKYADHADQRPCGVDPPDHLDDAYEDALHAGDVGRIDLIRDDPVIQQQRRKRQKECQLTDQA